MPIGMKGGKKGRKIGKGKRKLAQSRWINYSNLMSHSASRKLARMARREKRLRQLADKRSCTMCGLNGFSSRRELKRHRKFIAH